MSRRWSSISLLVIPYLFGKVVYASLGHVTNLSFTGGRAAR